MKRHILIASIFLSGIALTATSGNLNDRLSVKQPHITNNSIKRDAKPLQLLDGYNAKNKLTPATSSIISEAPAGTVMQEVTWSSKACYPANGQLSWTVIEGFVPTIVTSGSKMYIYAPITQLSDVAAAWIVGNISEDGKSVEFPTPQAYMINEATPGVPTMLYATRVSSTTGKPDGETDIVFAIGEDGGLTQTDGGLLALTDIDGGFYGYGDMEIVVSKINDTYTTLPENANPETFILDFSVGTEKMRQSALIAKVGEEVFFSDPLAIEGVWFKGRLESNKVVVKTPQYMSAKSGYPLYLVVAEEFTRTETDPLGQIHQVLDYNVLPGKDIIFDYDPATGVYSTDQLLLLSSDKDKRGMASAAVKSPVYTPWTPEACVPATPSVTFYFDLKDYEAYGLKGCMISYDIPNQGTDGEFIPQESLYYTIFFDGEPLEFYGFTRIPYYGQFQDAATGTALSVSGSQHQLQIVTKPQESLAIQSFYLFNYDFIESETASYKIVDGQLVGNNDAVENIIGTDEVIASEYFDLTGQRTNVGAAGIIIRKDIMSDGSTRCKKIFNPRCQ